MNNALFIDDKSGEKSDWSEVMVDVTDSEAPLLRVVYIRVCEMGQFLSLNPDCIYFIIWHNIVSYNKMSGPDLGSKTHSFFHT